MKFAIPIICLLCLSVCPGHAQKAASWGMYGNLQLTQALYTGVKGGFDVHWHQKHSVGINMAWVQRKAGNIPGDYDLYAPHSWFSSNQPYRISITSGQLPMAAISRLRTMPSCACT